MISKENLILLKQKMEELETLTASVKETKDRHKKELAPMNDLVTGKTAEIDKLKAEIEKEALAEYEKTGKKKLTGKIGIQERGWKKIIYDQQTAETWAKEKEIFQVFDKKAFEDSVDKLNLDFVTIKTGTDTKVTFPKKIEV